MPLWTLCESCSNCSTSSLSMHLLRSYYGPGPVWTWDTEANSTEPLLYTVVTFVSPMTYTYITAINILGEWRQLYCGTNCSYFLLPSINWFTTNWPSITKQKHLCTEHTWKPEQSTHLCIQRTLEEVVVSRELLCPRVVGQWLKRKPW